MPIPEILLAFANDRAVRERYLRNLLKARQLRALGGVTSSSTVFE
jgi:hypothetical protein